MKILITILLALFISSNTYADEERANRDMNIMEYGDVLASGLDLVINYCWVYGWSSYG